jgi:hypothetical protein
VTKYKLIPEEAQVELERQDAARASAPKGEAAAISLRNSILRQVGPEFALMKWGAFADVAAGRGGVEVTLPIRRKYKIRTLGKFEAWLCSYRNGCGAPWIQFSPTKQLRGFIFNEGGRGVTLGVLLDTDVPVRLYVAGWVLTLCGKKWFLRRPPKKFDGFRKMLKTK